MGVCEDVANTLWAYATMRALEGRAEALAGTFKAQEVANTLRMRRWGGSPGRA